MECEQELRFTLSSQVNVLFNDSPCIDDNIPLMDACWDEYEEGSYKLIEPNFITFESLYEIVKPKGIDDIEFVAISFDGHEQSLIDNGRNMCLFDSDLGDHTSPYVVERVSHFPCKDDYIDMNSFCYDEKPRNASIRAYTLVFIVWCQPILISYCHFSKLCGSMFDRLLRSLNCYLDLLMSNKIMTKDLGEVLPSMSSMHN
mgnify:CR=1 FL=1